jgi:arabinofuranosyltransferase
MARTSRPPAAARPRRPLPSVPSGAAKAQGPASAWPDARDLVDPRGPFLAPLFLLIAGRVCMWIYTPVAAEDAYITFRYARNLVAGNGLFYNPGEHVMGFTSPLWTVWSALGVLLTRDAASWARGWSVIADIVTLLVGGKMLERASSRASALTFTLFFAAWPYFSALCASGMEMSLCMALLVLAAALVSARSWGSGPALAALALTRPEGFAAAIVLSQAGRWRDRLVALGIVALGVGALVALYGSPIPNSLLIKAAVYGTPGPWAGRHWWEWISPVIFGRWPSQGDTSLLLPLMIVAAASFAIGLVELWNHRDSAVARAAAAAVLVWIGYAVTGVAYFWWYLSLPLLGMALVSAVGLPRIVRGRAIPVALMVLVLSIWTIGLQLYAGRAEQEARAFGPIATRLASLSRPGNSVMLEPIGMIGYFAPVRVIDETGLVTPEIARRRRGGPGWYADIVAERRPDWLVVRPEVLSTSRAFAGVGRPFRDAAERDSLLARYRVCVDSARPGSDSGLLLLQRTR